MVELAVRDLESACRWLIDHVGMRVVRSDPAGPFVLLESGGSRLALVQRDPPTTGVNLVFAVADLDQVLDRCRAAGVDCSPPVDVPRESYRRFTATGPEGWKVTFFHFNSSSAG
jgi:predicted enzyme related to lactoylglutathione lyase